MLSKGMIFHWNMKYGFYYWTIFIDALRCGHMMQFPSNWPSDFLIRFALILTKIIPFYMYHLSFKREVKKPIENLIASDFLSTFWGKSWYHNNLIIIVLIKCYMYNKIDCQVASCDHLNNQLSWTSCFEIGWKIISYVRPHLKIYILNLQNSGLEL